MLAQEIILSNPRAWYGFFSGKKIKLLDQEMLASLIKDGHSFIRWGDGETAITRRKSISFQASDDELRERLLKLLENSFQYSILGLPWQVTSSFLDSRWNLRTIKIMLSTRVLLIKALTRTKTKQSLYAPADFWWYQGKSIREFLTNSLRGRNCLLIASNPKYLDFCPPDSELLLIPKIDAFDDYEEISRKVSIFIENKLKDNVTLLCSMGPTTKALFVDFGRLCQVLDIGHGFSFALGGVGNWAWRRTKEIDC